MNSYQMIWIEPRSRALQIRRLEVEIPPFCRENLKNFPLLSKVRTRFLSAHYILSFKCLSIELYQSGLCEIDIQQCKSACFFGFLLAVMWFGDMKIASHPSSNACFFLNNQLVKFDELSQFDELAIIDDGLPHIYVVITIEMPLVLACIIDHFK